MSVPAPIGTAGNRQALREQPELRQYLSFTLGNESFALPVGCIREIIEFGGLTQIPLMPPFLRGVINLRGAVVPVIDLSVRFGRGETTMTRRTCIIILEIGIDEQVMPLGVLVDAVNEVLDVDTATIEPAPAFGARIRTDFIGGIFNHGGRFVISLDIERVLSVEEMANLIGIAEAVPEAGTAVAA